MEERMNLSKCLAFACVLALGLSPGLAHAEGAPPCRQYYGSWQKASSYYYRAYYYKPTAEYSGYKHHWVVWYPKQPDYYYYYNPYSQQFWGRCPRETGGKPLYSVLQPEDRPKPAEVSETPPKASFPDPGLPPKIPQTAAEKKEDPQAPPLDLPPDDPPTKIAGPGD
jgi:hypothetical protein